MSKRLINIRVTIEEYDLLSAYADKTGRTKTDVMRALIRTLKGK